MRAHLMRGGLVLMVFIFMASITVAQNHSPADSEARMDWWRDARFGMFIHWGLYSIPAGEWEGESVDGIGEWIMNHAQIKKKDYVPLQNQFNPINYDPDEWVRMAKEAGMKYIVITSKHHDGFCLWDSTLTEFDVANTPYGEDLLGPLAKACREQGIQLGFYHSIMDWTHPNYVPLPEWDADRENHDGDYEAYVAHMKGQLKELVTEYDPVILWFDGEWEDTWTHEHGKMLYDYVRELKPSILINNRVDKGRQGMAGLTKSGDYRGDFGTPEQEIPESGMPGVDWETCMTMNDTWGYKKNDNNWKTSETLIRNLIDTASKGGNFLLNVGPTADGRIPQASVTRLREIGDWMEVNGESIYETEGGSVEAPAWGRITRKPGKVYLHIFEWPVDGTLVVPGLDATVTTVYPLADKDKELAFSQRSDDSIELDVSDVMVDGVATVIVMDVAL